MKANGPKHPYGNREKWSLDPITGCHVWEGAVASGGGGYGYLKIDEKTVKAVKYFWEKANGPIPPGHELSHTCHNSRCVNLAHLRVTTHQENLALSGYCKIRPGDAELVEQMLAEGATQSEIAERFDCTQSAVSHFCARYGIGVPRAHR